MAGREAVEQRSVFKFNGAAVPPVAEATVAPAQGEPRVRYADGWRSGKPEEDPAKLKRWGFVAARPSEFLICMRGGRVLTSGQGATVFKWPWDSVAVVPTTVQRLHFIADQVTCEKVGVQVTGLAVYRIAEPLIAFRMLNFSYPERAQEKLEQLLSEMFVGAARRLVSNLTVEQCLAKRKEGIGSELMREISPVVSGTGRTEDRTHQGWGVVLDSIEIQDVRVQSQTVFANLQATYREDQDRRAREAELSKDRALQQGHAEAHRQIALSKLEAEGEVLRRRQEAEERTRLAELATQARLAEAKLAHQQAMAQAQMESAVRHAQFEAQAEAARHQAKLSAARQEALELGAAAEAAEARRRLAEVLLTIAQIDARRVNLAHEFDVARSRALKEIENTISPEAVQLQVAHQLPALAAALQQKLGEVHITAVDGANPFGYIASAVEAVLGMARAAGLTLPRNDPPGE